MTYLTLRINIIYYLVCFSVQKSSKILQPDSRANLKDIIRKVYFIYRRQIRNLYFKSRMVKRASKSRFSSQVWWLTPVIPALGRQRQEQCFRPAMTTN